ncbi:unnamed protein product [Clonostachys byssicola]|uniref:Uncharacterized protein n=1 Tax=Clonostachys byssicola TaxID=160290 RepID=A0A9N9UV40_9HYPO|nr:unnamed protein product [Clonostachys byssicola]
MAPEKKEREDDLGEEVQNAVEDGLGVWVDDIAAFGATEGDGVQKKGGDEDNARDVVGGSDGSPDIVRTTTSNDEYRERSNTKGPESPFVGGLSKCTKQVADDHGLVNQYDSQQSRPGDACRKEECREKERRGDEPVDVASIEDLSSTGSHHLASPDELDLNGNLSQVRAHGEVGDAADEERNHD